MEYAHIPASRGAANTGLGLGIAGTALGLLNGGLNLFGGQMPYGTPNACNHYELGLAEENAFLKSQAVTDTKIVEAFNALNDKIQKFKDEQYQINTAQAAYNAANNGHIACLQAQVHELEKLTKLMIPSENIYTPTAPTA